MSSKEDVSSVQTATRRSTGERVFKHPYTKEWLPLIHQQSVIEEPDGTTKVYDETVGRFLPTRSLVDEVKLGFDDLQLSLAGFGNQFGLASDEFLAQQQRDLQEQEAQTAINPETAAFQQRLEDINNNLEVGAGRRMGQAALEYVTNPGQAIRQLARLTPQALPVGAAAVAGGVAAAPLAVPLGLGAAGTLAATAAGAGIGGAIGQAPIDSGISYNQQLSQRAASLGEDLSDPNALARVKNQVNPATGMTYGDEASMVASRETLARAPANFAAGALGARTAGLINQGAPVLRTTVAGLAQQGLAGGAGEISGSLAADRIIEPSDVTAEIVLEAFGGIPEIASQALAQRKVNEGLEKEVDEELDTELPEVKAANNPQRVQLVLQAATRLGIPQEALQNITPESIDRIAVRLRKIQEQRQVKTVQTANELNRLVDSGVTKEQLSSFSSLATPDTINIEPKQGQSPRTTLALPSPDMVAEQEAVRQNQLYKEKGKKAPPTESDAKYEAQLERSNRALESARIIARVRAENAYKEMSTPGKTVDSRRAAAAFKRMSPNKEEYVSTYISNFAPRIAQELGSNTDWLAGKAELEKDNKGRFTGKLRVKPAEPAELLFSRKQEEQRQLERVINNPSNARLLSQEEALVKQTPEVQQATKQMDIDAFSKQQEEARQQRKQDALALTQAARQSQTVTNPTTGITRPAPRSGKRKLSSILPFPTRNNPVLNMRNREALSATDRLRTELNNEMKYLDNELRNVMKRLGIADKVDFRLVLDKIDGASGMVEDVNGSQILTLAVMQPEGRTTFDTLNHETIHVLRNLNLITPSEWRTLSNEAKKNDWVGFYKLRDNPAYSELTEEGLIEEAIAEHFASTESLKEMAKDDNPTLTQALMRRIKSALKILKAYIDEVLGFPTTEEVLDIFSKISSGEVGRRILPDGRLTPQRRGTRWNDNVKFAKNLTNQVRQAKKFKLTGDQQKLLTKKAPMVWPILGRWFNDVTTLAGRFPSVRPYAAAMDAINKTDHKIRQQVNSTIIDIFKDVKDEKEKETLTRAALVLTLKEKPFALPRDGKGILLTMDKDFYGVGKAGDTIPLTARQVGKLNELFDMYKGVGLRYINSVAVAAFTHLKTKDDSANLNEVFAQAGDGNIMYREAGAMSLIPGRLDTLLRTDTITPEVHEAAMGVWASLNDQRNLVENFNYIPFLRTSPFFMDFTNSKGDKVTIALPTSPLGDIATGNVVTNTILGGSPLAKFVEKRLQELKELDSTYETDFKYRKVDVTQNFSVSERELSAFEKLAYLNASKDSAELADKIFASIRKEMATKGFNANWTTRKNIPGFVHPDNISNYLAASSVIYGDRAANSISINENQQSVNKAISELTDKVQNGEVHQSVLDFVNEHYSYLTDPEQQEGDLSARLRGFTFHMFLGFLNPAPALLNLFQILHTTLPGLTAAFDSFSNNSVQLTKAVTTAAKFINADFLAPDVFKTGAEVKGVKPSLVQMVQALRDEGILKVVLTEEMQAKAVVGGVVGGQTKLGASAQQFLEKTSNLSSSLFSRTEALNRLTTAIASYELAEKALKTKEGKERLQKYLSTTKYSGMSLNNPTEIAAAMVDLTQFDTTKFNRAPIFRGNVMSVATQFMAFPVRMVQFYVDMLMNALGGQRDDGGRIWFKDSTTKAAFTVMALGLVGTSGLYGAIPMGGAAADAYDLIIKEVTGVDPDIDRKIRTALVDLTGDSQMAEMVMRGPISSLFGVDIGERVGAQLFSGVQTDFKLLDMLGPFGGLTEQALQAHERLNQGNELLAVAQLLPSTLRNIIRAYYEGEYGIVTGQGNIVPTDFTTKEAILQGAGFAPQRLRETRELLFAQQRLGQTSAVARERFTDRMTAARVKALLARKNGKIEDFQQYINEYRKLRQELIDFNRKAAPEEKINIENTMKTVQKRVKDQMNAITRNTVTDRRIPVQQRKTAEELQSVYPGGYLQGRE